MATAIVGDPFKAVDLLQESMKEAPAALRDDIKLLGRLLGEVLREVCGVELFDAVEKVRFLSKRARAGESKFFLELREFLAGLDESSSCTIARAFSHFLNLANVAEQIHRVRRTREYAGLSEAKAMRGSLDSTLRLLLDNGCKAEDIQKTLCEVHIELVLTAHPTEVSRRTLLKKHTRIASMLLMLDDTSENNPVEDLSPHCHQYDSVLRMFERISHAQSQH